MLLLVQVLSTAVRHRRVGSHELNMESSRSHSIFTGGLSVVCTASCIHASRQLLSSKRFVPCSCPCCNDASS